MNSKINCYFSSILHSGEWKENCFNSPPTALISSLARNLPAPSALWVRGSSFLLRQPTSPQDNFISETFLNTGFIISMLQTRTWRHREVHILFKFMRKDWKDICIQRFCMIFHIFLKCCYNYGAFSSRSQRKWQNQHWNPLPDNLLWWRSFWALS